MVFLPITFILFILLMLFVLILLILLPFHVMGIAFQKLGLSTGMGVVYFIASLIGSTINIPIKEQKCDRQPTFTGLTRFFYGGIPIPARKKVLAINLGGAIIPLLLALYLLLTRAPLVPTAIATIIMIVLTKFLARPVPNVGIALPALIPPILSVILAWILYSPNPAPVAYVSGVVGTLIGADLLNLKRMESMSCGIMSIGGAGVFDGIYLVGIIAVLLA